MPEKNRQQRPHRVSLPGFITDNTVGLGDVIKHATSSLGIKPCGGCEARAAALNGWLAFSGKRTPKSKQNSQGINMQSEEIKMQSCTSCENAAVADQSAGSSESFFVYALGQVEARFPRLAVEKEFAQATARTVTKGQTDGQAFYSVLAERENRYLAREMCWVFTIQGLEAYILKPREQADLDLLIKAVAPKPTPWISAVIGTRGPNAAPEQCNGLMLPIVVFDQIYSFDTPGLVTAIPKPDKMAAKAFEPAAQELFERLMLMTDNAGATDEHRALNYLAMRYPAIYGKAAEMFAEGCALSGVDTDLSTLSSARTIMDVVFSFTNRTTDYTEKFFTRVDVTEEYPFLVTKLSPYYAR